MVEKLGEPKHLRGEQANPDQPHESAWPWKPSDREPAHEEENGDCECDHTLERPPVGAPLSARAMEIDEPAAGLSAPQLAPILLYDGHDGLHAPVCFAIEGPLRISSGRAGRFRMVATHAVLRGREI